MSEASGLAAALAGIASLKTAEAPDAKSGCQGLHTVGREAIVEVGRVFREAGYMLEMLTALDMRAAEQAMHVVYQFNRFGAPDRHRVRVVVPAGEAVPSLADLFGSANWYEREAFDMLGVRFDGHPYLVRILTEEGADYHPLLKDFGVAPAAAEEAAGG
ncbi:MAG: NADH-quinone oxidoreductase subunit C [Candidatus Sumerlaeia bacterium]|nr:NADH-quinone oxidoreductase subunit C [Candidatus Sumerlaeia bacterium]